MDKRQIGDAELVVHYSGKIKAINRLVYEWEQLLPVQFVQVISRILANDSWKEK